MGFWTVLLELGVGCVGVFAGQSSLLFAGDKYRNAELIADHSADEIGVWTINGTSGRAGPPPAAVTEGAEGLSSAGVELAGMPLSVVLERSEAVGGKLAGDGRSSSSDCLKLGSLGRW